MVLQRNLSLSNVTTVINQVIKDPNAQLEISVKQKQGVGGWIKGKENVSNVVESDTSQNSVHPSKRNQTCGTKKIESVQNSKAIKLVNIKNDLSVQDATVTAMVGMGGQMLKFPVLLDTGADFSCARNAAIIRLREAGINFVLSDPGTKGHGCVANESQWRNQLRCRG